MEIENEIEDMIKVILRVPIRKRGRFNCTSKRGAIVSYVRSAGLRPCRPHSGPSVRTRFLSRVYFTSIYGVMILYFIKWIHFAKYHLFFKFFFTKNITNIFVKTFS
jgi:hypothetical protein